MVLEVMDPRTMALAYPAVEARIFCKFDAFGTTPAAIGATPNLDSYTGEKLDPNVVFHYLRARYCNPASGRFTDPELGSIFEPATLHRRLYAGGSPVDIRDPAGQVSMPELTLVPALGYSSTLAQGFCLRTKR